MLISLLICILLIPFILLTVLGLISNYSNIPYDIIKNSNLSEVDKERARTCLKQVKTKALKGLIYDVTAPYVMLFVLPFVKREATKLPSLFSNWDNEISINGDGWGKELPDCTWVTVRETGDPDCIPYDHPDYQGDAYYAKGHHPRSFIARYVWMGWRNRASKLAYDQGEYISEYDKSTLKTYGTPAVLDGYEGWVILNIKDLYEVYQIKKGKYFTKRTRYGHKLGNTLRYNAAKAMLATIGVSYKRNKDNLK